MSSRIQSGKKKKTQASKENTRCELGVVPVCWMADKSRPAVHLDLMVLLAQFCLEPNLLSQYSNLSFKKKWVSITRISAPTSLLVFCTEMYARWCHAVHEHLNTHSRIGLFSRQYNLFLLAHTGVHWRVGTMNDITTNQFGKINIPLEHMGQIWSV